MNSTESTIIDNAYKYYAFISYKRADSKWADWLYGNLQKYRLPGKLCKKYSELAQRLCPIFMDRQELPPGALSETLKKHIALSKYFISVCSKNTQDNPLYIDLELQYFLETHDNDYTKVIPFIVDESEKPEAECFSPLMQELCAKYQLIGVNIHEKGKRRAFLKVVAYMHGILVSEIESADDIRRRRNTVSAAFAGILTVVITLCGMVYYWNHYAMHTDYYLGCVWEKNVAKGVGKIAKKDLSDYARYYLFESIDGRVQSVEYKNYAGTTLPLDEEATVLNQNASRIEFSYTGKDMESLFTAQYYDYNGLPLVCYQYSADGTHVTLLQDESSGISGYASQNIMTVGTDEEKINISRYVQEYDDRGLLIRRYYAYGADYLPISDGTGTFGYDLTYDDKGTLSAVTYFSTADGAVIGEVNGISSVTYTYEPDSARMQSVSYLDKDNNLINGAEGWAKKEYTWNDLNAREKVSFYGQDKALTLCEDGYASIEYTYNGTVLSKEACYGLKGEAIAVKDGYSSVTMEANQKGEIISIEYWDAAQNPTVNKELGAYGYKIDERNEKERVYTYLDKDGAPMMTQEGYAYKYIQYDEYMHPVRIEYRDINHKLSTEHYAICTYTYDEIYHNVLEWCFYDENERLVINPQLDCAAIINEYDSRGYMTLITYLGEDGQLYNGNRGHAKIECIREQEGNYTTETVMFYGEDNQPVMDETFQSYGYEFTRDESGRLIGLYYLDKDKFPYFNAGQGYAGVVYLYDDYGYISQVAYFGELMQSVMVDGYAIMRSQHDEHGNTLSRTYYNDKNEAAVNEIEGYAHMIAEYEEDRLVAVAYYDANGCYMNHLHNGYAAASLEYDEMGELCGGSLFKAEDGQLVFIK